jgi:hypothetical protein
VATVIALNGMRLEVMAAVSGDTGTFKPDVVVTFASSRRIDELPGNMTPEEINTFSSKYSASMAPAGEETSYDRSTHRASDVTSESFSWSEQPEYLSAVNKYLVAENATVTFTKVHKLEPR